MVDLLESCKIERGQRLQPDISADSLRQIYDNMDYFASPIALRPQEISNNPEVTVVWASSL
ncbi:hypothetical protein ACNKHX_17680 [Shigella flexneri]